jgi:hypothetical protein
VRRTASREANQIDKQWQARAIMAGRHIDIDNSIGRIAQNIIAKMHAVDIKAVHSSGRMIGDTHGKAFG